MKEEQQEEIVQKETAQEENDLSQSEVAKKSSDKDKLKIQCRCTPEDLAEFKRIQKLKGLGEGKEFASELVKMLQISLNTVETQQIDDLVQLRHHQKIIDGLFVGIAMKNMDLSNEHLSQIADIKSEEQSLRNDLQKEISDLKQTKIQLQSKVDMLTDEKIEDFAKVEEIRDQLEKSIKIEKSQQDTIQSLTANNKQLLAQVEEMPVLKKTAEITQKNNTELVNEISVLRAELLRAKEMHEQAVSEAEKARQSAQEALQNAQEAAVKDLEVARQLHTAALATVNTEAKLLVSEAVNKERAECASKVEALVSKNAELTEKLHALELELSAKPPLTK